MTNELYNFLIERGDELCYMGGEPFPAWDNFTVSDMEEFQKYLEDR